MEFELDENQFITLGLVFGYNKSDASYGWNGFEHGAELYYSHITDETVDTAQSIPLTAGLEPIISLQNIQNTYLGTPYTSCIGSFPLMKQPIHNEIISEMVKSFRCFK